MRYEQLSEQNNTTIKLLEEQSEKLREEVERLRHRGEVSAPLGASGVNGDVNGTSSTTSEAVSVTSPQSNGMIIMKQIHLTRCTCICVT